MPLRESGLDSKWLEFLELLKKLWGWIETSKL
jgi:hypothetical protein